MMVSGKKVNIMGLAHSHGQMVVYIKVNGNNVKNTEKESFMEKMALYMKVNGVKVNIMEEEN